MKTLHDMGSFEWTGSRDPSLNRKRSIPAHTICTMKMEGLTCVKAKGRCVAGGHLQPDDGCDTFAPTPSLTSFRVLNGYAAKYGCHIETADVTAAFLTAYMRKTDVSIRPPKGVIPMPGDDGYENVQNLAEGEYPVLKLKRPLYGMRDSPEIYATTARRILESDGFRASTCDPCVFIKKLEENGKPKMVKKKIPVIKNSLGNTSTCASSNGGACESEYSFAEISLCY